MTPDHNLPPNYPVVDRFVNGHATSDKTIDLLSKYPQSPTALRSTVRGYIDKLAAFQGRRYAGRNIPVGSIHSRELLIGVQPGTMTPGQAAVFHELQQHAQSRGVTLKVVEIP